MVFINICLVLFLLANNANGIGVNWGSTTSHNIKPGIVAQMLKDNGIDSVKLYGSDSSMIKAFANTGISVMVGIPNQYLKKIIDNDNNAKDWVEASVVKHEKEGVKITYVAVGNEPFLTDYNGVNLNDTFAAVKNIQKALDMAGLGNNIKTTLPLNEDVYDSRLIAPSKSDFREDIKDIIVEIVHWLDINNSTFLVNINPFHSYQDLDLPKDFIFFTPNAKPIVTDDKTIYNNFFDLSVDKLASSLDSAGVPNLKIMVEGIGWPTDGGINANITLAQRFYAGFLKKLGSNKGTPLRPGPMDIYLSSLLDENMRSIIKGNQERHWGIFRYDGVSKYPMDFSGQGRDVMLVNAMGVQKQDALYCIFDKKDYTDMSLVPANIEYICKTADCTALTYGSSCNNLTYVGNISYMFNMYYQIYNHDNDACNFNGLATLSFLNFSTDTCLFPIQLKSGGDMKVVLGPLQIVVGVMVTILLALF